MKTKLTFFIIILSNVLAFGTAQVPDILYWNNDTLEFYDSSLENYSAITKRLFEDFEIMTISSGCWRKFVAKWTIIDNELYLVNIETCEDDISLNNKISEIVGKPFVNGKLKADWISGKYWCGSKPTGSGFYLEIYANEYFINIQNGQLSGYKKSQKDSCEYIVKRNPLLIF